MVINTLKENVEKCVEMESEPLPINMSMFTGSMFTGYRRLPINFNPFCNILLQMDMRCTCIGNKLWHGMDTRFQPTNSCAPTE